MLASYGTVEPAAGPDEGELVGMLQEQQSEIQRLRAELARLGQHDGPQPQSADAPAAGIAGATKAAAPVGGIAADRAVDGARGAACAAATTYG